MAWALLPVAVLLAVPVPRPGGADGAGAVHAPTVAAAAHGPDSTELRARARDAQRRFERTRRRHLPTGDDGGGGPCDDRVGRMCWRQLPGAPWFPGPESPGIVDAREALLATLDSVGRAIPGDGWVLGQRVHYLGEAGRWEEAGALAARCELHATWWCRALEGLTLHVRGLYPEAEAAFAAAMAALAATDPAEARRWIDPGDLVDGDARGLLEDARDHGDPAWGEAVDRLWRLADPLLLVEGNERRTEHFARHTALRIREDARNPHGIGWGPDLAELLLRYGWEVGWERTPRRLTQVVASEGVVGHEHPESRSYLPSGSVLEDPAAAGSDAWVPRLAYARSTYAPAAAPVFLPMDVPVSVLPRGDRMMVVVPFRLPPDTTLATRRGDRPPFQPLAVFADRPPEAGLFLSSLADGGVRAARAAGVRQGTLLLEVPAGRWWLSAEAWDPSSGRAGRLRLGLDRPSLPPDVATLSDLLLLDPGPEPATLEEAAPRVRPHLAAASGESVVVAWEVSGLGWGATEPFDYALSLEETGGGLLRRAGEWLGLVGRERPVALVWEEADPSSPGRVFRSVTLQLPEIGPGTYVLRLELRTRGRAPLRSIRVLQVAAPAGR